MRILVVGAGAIGGYFGGRLLQAGCDVTFLVRERRAAQLLRSGLTIRSVRGDVHLPHPPLVQADALRDTFDLILLSCKAYDLHAAIDAFAPAVGSHTAILPILNGLRHLDALGQRFGPEAAMGGQCLISAGLDAQGTVLHFNDMHGLTFGELGGRSVRAEKIRDELARARIDVTLSEEILLEMWEKWVFIAAMAGVTCLFRAPIGDIVAADGPEFAAALLNECAEVARRAGFAVRETSIARGRGILTNPTSTLAASMLRDIERGGQTEVEEILGDLLRRQSPETSNVSLLRLAYAHVKAYETRRAREMSRQ